MKDEFAHLAQPELGEKILKDFVASKAAIIMSPTPSPVGPQKRIAFDKPSSSKDPFGGMGGVTNDVIFVPPLPSPKKEPKMAPPKPEFAVVLTSPSEENMTQEPDPFAQKCDQLLQDLQTSPSDAESIRLINETCFPQSPSLLGITIPLLSHLLITAAE